MGVVRETEGVEQFLEDLKGLENALAPVALAARLGDGAARDQKNSLLGLAGKRVACICACSTGSCSNCIFGARSYVSGWVKPPAGFRSWCEVAGDFTGAVFKMRGQADLISRMSQFCTTRNEVECAEKQLEELRAKYLRDCDGVEKRNAELGALKADVIEKAHALGIDGVPACCGEV